MPCYVGSHIFGTLGCVGIVLVYLQLSGTVCVDMKGLQEDWEALGANTCMPFYVRDPIAVGSNGS